MSLFDPDGKFMRLTSTMLDYVKLGLLFMLFSIPVIPMGAAAAAAMTVGMWYMLLVPGQYQISKRSFFGRIVSFFAASATVPYSSPVELSPSFLCLA